MSSVYLILNETAFTGTDQISTEPVEVFDNLQAAAQFLADLALEYDVAQGDDEHSIYIPPAEGMESDEYYIVEMELKS